MVWPYREYTHEEQGRRQAAGLRMMVDAERYIEDEDGVCRQKMVWLERHGMGRIRWDGEEEAEMVVATVEPPIPPGREGFVLVEDEGYWCPWDDYHMDWSGDDETVEVWLLQKDQDVDMTDQKDKDSGVDEQW